MSSCEKCWNDAFLRSVEGPDDQAAAYAKLLRERAVTPCTPEEQAGPDALWCPVCGRRTWHQAAKLCTVNARHGQDLHASPSFPPPQPPNDKEK